MRIGDYLLEELLDTLSDEDIYEPVFFEKLKSQINGEVQIIDKKDKYFYRLNIFIKFLIKTCNIKVSFCREKIISSLRGPDKWKLFQKIEELGLAFMFKNENIKVKNIEKIENLWRFFFEIYKEITAGDADYVSVKNKTAAWFSLFKGLYVQQRITPYIHAFVDHVWEFVKIHKNIHLFNEHGILLVLVLIFLSCFMKMFFFKKA